MASLLGSLFTNLRGAFIVTPWVFYLGFADLALSLLLPIKIIAPNLVYGLSSRIAFSVWRWIQAIFENVNGAHITVSGDQLPRGESAIIVANHVSWTDFYMIQTLAVRANMLSRCRWFAKSQLRVVPFLGWGLWALGMPMVSRNWMRDQHELNRVFRGVVEKKWPIWLISFSEATRYTPQKYRETRAWCAQNSRPLPQHLLYPRTKGFVTTIKHLRQAPHIKAVYDLSIAYQQGKTFLEAPNIWQTLKLPDLSGTQDYRFHVHARRFPLEDLPQTDEELAGWLEERWIEKGVWLEEKRKEWERSV